MSREITEEERIAKVQALRAARMREHGAFQAAEAVEQKMERAVMPVEDLMRQDYRVLSSEEQGAMATLKAAGSGLATLIRDTVPAGREASLAVTKVEEAVMWAVKGLTR